MHKNFKNFLAEFSKEPNTSDINEVFGLFTQLNFDEEEKKLIYKLNNAFKNYTNNLIGLNYSSSVINKKFPINIKIANSIYNNLKNNLQRTLSLSYKKQKLNDENYLKFFKIEDLIKNEEEKEKEKKDQEKKSQEQEKQTSEEKPAAIAPAIAEPPTPPSEPETPAASVTAPREEIPVLGGIADFHFMKNLNKLISFVNARFKQTNGYVPEKTPFKTLELMRRLFRYSETHDNPKMRVRKHQANINFLGNEKWHELITKVIETLKSKNCNFSDDEFTNELISLFDKYSVEGWFEGMLNNMRRKSKPWSSLLVALTQINNYINEFCTANPNLCGEKGKGSSKLLQKLQENKNTNFSNWLFIQENKLF